MAMGSSATATTTTTSGDASPTDVPDRGLYTNGGDKANDNADKGKALTKQHYKQLSAEDDECPAEDAQKAPSLTISDTEYTSGTLHGLSKLRKNRQFCDVILQVNTYR